MTIIYDYKVYLINNNMVKTDKITIFLSQNSGNDSIAHFCRSL